MLSNVNQLTYGMDMPRLGTNDARNLLIPLPPLTEQQQIVEKLNRLLAEIDELKTQEQALLATQNAFPKKLRAALLQAAVQGELNERTDENAGDLLATVFGNQGSARAAEGLGQSTGLGSQGASKLVTLLLPVVLSFLAGRYLGRNGGGKEQMNEALANEQQQINAQTGGGLSGLLDQNGDGKLDMHDIVKLGSSLFGGR